jgi:nucleotide-binding universal stress UspA family protein
MVAEHPEVLTEKEQEFLGTLQRLVPEKAEALGRSRRFVEIGSVRERILEHAKDGGVDLIVLGAHHHSQLAMLFRTGPAFQIIVAATCPVLTICRP